MNFIPQTLSDYLEILFKRRDVFLTPFVAVLCLAALAYPIVPRTYRSSALVQLEDDKLISPLIQGLAVKATVDKKVQNLTAQILSWTSLAELARATGMADKVQDSEQMDALLRKIKDRITLRTMSEKIVQVNYEHKDPHMALNMTAAIADSLVNKNRAEKEMEAQAAIKFIDDQLRVYKDRLQGSEKTFFINKINNDLNDAIKRRALLADQIARTDKVIVTEVVRAQNPQIWEMRKDLLQAESLLAQLNAEGQAGNNPLVPELQQKVDSLRKRVRFQEESQAGSETASTNPAYQEVMRQIKELDLNISALQKRKSDMEQGRISNARVSEQDLLAMERDKKVNEDIYQSLLMRLENAHISQQLDAQGFNRGLEIIDPARLPVKPSSPNPVKFFMMALAAALAAGAGMVFIAEYLDGSFRNTEDAKAALGVPLLASLPRMVFGQELKPARYGKKYFSRELYLLDGKKDPSVSPWVVAHHDPDSFPVEQLRLLRTQIFAQNGNQAYKALLFTGAQPGEGATISTVNLAVSIAQESMMRVLLIDCDLRNGSISQLLPVKSPKGLSDYLAGEASLDEVLKPSVSDRLTLLPAGKLTANPSRLLTSGKMAQLVGELRGRFDLILIDAAPVLNFSDVPVLMNHVDGVVMVARAGKTSRGLVQEAILAVQRIKKAPFIGLFLTNVESHIPTFFQRLLRFSEASTESYKGEKSVTV